MSYLRQQRALYATVGALAGAALFVDTKARGCMLRCALLAWLQAAAAARAAAARACGGVRAQRQRDALRRAGRERACDAAQRTDECGAPRCAVRVQRLVLRTRAEMEDGWVNPPPATAPLPVRAAALGSVAAMRSDARCRSAAAAAAAVRGAQGAARTQLEQRCVTQPAACGLAAPRARVQNLGQTPSRASADPCCACAPPAVDTAAGYAIRELSSRGW